MLMTQPGKIAFVNLNNWTTEVVPYGEQKKREKAAKQSRNTFVSLPVHIYLFRVLCIPCGFRTTYFGEATNIHRAHQKKCNIFTSQKCRWFENKKNFGHTHNISLSLPIKYDFHLSFHLFDVLSRATLLQTWKEDPYFEQFHVPWEIIIQWYFCLVPMKHRKHSLFCGFCFETRIYLFSQFVASLLSFLILLVVLLSLRWSPFPSVIHSIYHSRR